VTDRQTDRIPVLIVREHTDIAVADMQIDLKFKIPLDDAIL